MPREKSPSPAVAAPAKTEDRERHQPSHKAYSVEKTKDAEGKDINYWTPIGSVFPHGDGKGFNIVLSAMPINNRIVLRVYEPRDPADNESDDRSGRTTPAAYDVASRPTPAAYEVDKPARKR